MAKKQQIVVKNPSFRQFMAIVAKLEGPGGQRYTKKLVLDFGAPKP